MISQRTRGLQNMLLAAQALILVLLMALCAQVTFTFFTSASVLHLERYPVYAAVVTFGLVVESLRRERSQTNINLVQRHFLDQHQVTLRQLAYSIGGLLIYLALMKDGFISRTFLLVYVPAVYAALLASNYFLPRVLARRIFRGVHEERTLLVGPLKRAEKLRGWAASKEMFGIRNVGLLTSEAPAGTVALGFRCLGTIQDAERIIVREGVTRILVLELPEDLAAHKRLFDVAEKYGVGFLILSNLAEKLEHPIVHVQDDGFCFIGVREEPLENPFNRIVKRALDLAIALPMVLLVLPVATVVTWVMHRCQSPGPIFYRQTRSGIQNRAFEIWKFRTMHVNATPSRQATESDDRIFPFGRWMRRYSFDELPQFVNVLRGEMSVTGPRPHLLEHNAQFAEHLASYHVRALIKPGITGLAQVRGFRGEARTSEDIAQRVASDISYLENWRFALDVSIIARTALHVLRPPKTAG